MAECNTSCGACIDSDSRAELVRLMPEIEKIKDEALREAVVKTWLSALESCHHTPQVLVEMPASSRLKDRCFGLIHHVRGVCQVAEAAYATFYSLFPEPPVRLNPDIIIAGALLHDVGKVAELEKGKDGWQWTPQSHYVRHAYTGVAYAARNGVPDSILQIIAYHTGEEVVVPRSAEAEVVHIADDMVFKPFFCRPVQ